VFPQAQGAPHVWQVRPAQVETKPQTYLGVSTRQLTPDVAAHIGEVPEGVGLIVSFVDAEGPAGKAGLQEHDVLVKIDDQWLINPQQFSVLVRMHKAGDEATLTVYRKGEEQEIGVELIEKELPVAQNFFGQMELTPLAVPGFGEGLEGLQGELAPMAVPGLWRGALELDAARREEIEQKVQEAMRQLEEQMARGQQNMPELREHMQALRESLRSRELDLERLRRDAAPGSELMQRGLTRGGRLLINNEEMSLSMLNEDDEITVKISDPTARPSTKVRSRRTSRSRSSPTPPRRSSSRRASTCPAPRSPRRPKRSRWTPRRPRPLIAPAASASAPERG
jgi:hypothetical protein